mgnify:CR=1 FL=1
MKKRRANPNKGIMFGIMAMAVVVLAVVVFFWMWCFPDGTEGARTEYRISLDEGFRGDSVQLQINDSVVFSRRVAADSLEVVVAVPDKENLLMVVRPEADAVGSFELPSEGGRVVLRNHDETVSMEAF